MRAVCLEMAWAGTCVPHAGWFFCDPKDCSPPGSSVPGISQARILEWVAISSSSGSPPRKNRTGVSCVGKHSFQQSPPPKFLFVVDFCSTPFLYRYSGAHHTPASFPRLQEKKAVLFSSEKTPQFTGQHEECPESSVSEDNSNMDVFI